MVRESTIIPTQLGFTAKQKHADSTQRLSDLEAAENIFESRLMKLLQRIHTDMNNRVHREKGGVKSGLNLGGRLLIELQLPARDSEMILQSVM